MHYSRYATVLLTAASVWYDVSGFNIAVGGVSRGSSSCSSTCLHAIGVLARKAKEMNVKKYIDSGEMSPEVADILKSLESSSEADDAPLSSSEAGPLQSALTKRRGTITVIAEYKRRLDRGSFIDEIYEPTILSPTFREFGASAVAIMADPVMGGCDYEDLTGVHREQETARGDVPGPLPLISSDLIVHPVQLAQSKVAGCTGVVLRYGALGEERAPVLWKQARKLDLEPIVQVDNQNEAQAAVDMGATILMFNVGGEGTEDDQNTAKGKMELVKSLRVPDAKVVCAVANIMPYDDKGLQEVEDAWVCRDAGFQAVWASDVLYKSGNDAVEHPGAIINSMKSKSSVKWASAKARGGKGEGAREYLGDILM